MIKFMVHFVKIVVTAIVALLFGSCQYHIDGIGETITGSGNVVTKERDLKDFTKIEVSRALDCEVYQSDNFKVEVIADDNLVNHIKTEVRNGKLKISSDYGNYRNVKSKLIRVYLPIIDVLEATSAANMTTKTTIKSNEILIKSSSAADINATVESEKIKLESTSGSDITASGKAIDLYTQSSSGSDINAGKLLANNVNSQSTSGSDTTVNPILSLSAKASSGASIEYTKTPKSISKQTTSGGSISSSY